MFIIYARKHACRRATISPRAAIFMLAMVVFSLGLSTSARADDSGRCPLIGEEPIGDEPAEATRAEAFSASEPIAWESSSREESAGGFRQKAAPFAPDIMLRFWYHERTRNQDRARSHAIAQLARPDQNINITRVPFGWQVSLSWNLVDIADTILPGDETPLRIYASDCAVFQRPLDALFEFGGAENSEASPQSEDQIQAQGDL